MKKVGFEKQKSLKKIYRRRYHQTQNIQGQLIEDI